jgi:hypothetical protein
MRPCVRYGCAMDDLTSWGPPGKVPTQAHEHGFMWSEPTDLAGTDGESPHVSSLHPG